MQMKKSNMNMNCENIDVNNMEIDSPVKKKRKTKTSKNIKHVKSEPKNIPINDGTKRNISNICLLTSMDTKRVKTSNGSDEQMEEIDKLALRLKSNVTTVDKTTTTQLGSNSSQLNSSNKSQNFISTLQKVASKKYADIAGRLNLHKLPRCCYDKDYCEKLHKNSEVQMISSYEKEAFKINFKSGLWDEALIVCHHTLNKNHYLSAEIILSIMEIILNVHQDSHKDYSLQYIIQGFEKIIRRMFIIHLPCSDRIIKNYSNFLTEPLVFESTSPERESNKPKLGLFKFILSRLEYELSADSPDGPIIKANIEKYDDNLNEVYMRKRKYEIYETHDRTERICRLFIVLDMIVELLENDLAIWMSKYIENPSRYVSGTKKPLAALLLWQNNPILTGIVTDNCRQIFRMYKNLVKLNYPSSRIKIFSRLVDIYSNTFYLCDKNCNAEYPNVGNCCITLANEFLKIIEGEEIALVILIIAKMNTTFLQYLVTNKILKSTVKSDRTEFILLIDDVFREQKWNLFPDIDINTMSDDIFQKKEIVRLKKSNEECLTLQNRAIDELKKSLKKHDTNFFYSTTFPGLWTKDKFLSVAMPVYYEHLMECKENFQQANVNIFNKSDFMIIFYLSFKFFLKLYNIFEIKKYYKITFESITKEKINKPPSSSVNDINHNSSALDHKHKIMPLNPLSLNAKCIKEYVLIFKTMKKIGDSYGELEKRNLLPSNMFDNLNFFPRKTT